MLVHHLVEHGHRRIAYIGAPAIFTLQTDRFEGYREGLAEAGIEFDPALVCAGDLSRNGGYHSAQVLLALPNPPTAILGVNDLTAIGAMRAVRERGLAVGRDIAVTGYDGTDDAEHCQPPLTTLKQPVYETSRQLAAILISRIQDGKMNPVQRIIQPQLIIRESTVG